MHDLGPFYVFTVGVPIHLVGQWRGVDHIRPCQITRVKTVAQWVDARRAGDDYALARRIETPEYSGQYRLASANESDESQIEEILYPIPARASLDSLISEYATRGLVHITGLVGRVGFTEQRKGQRNLPFWNKKLSGGAIMPHNVPESAKEDVRKYGALHVRRQAVNNAINAASVKGRDIAWLSECLESFAKVEVTANQYLDNVEARMRNRQKDPEVRTKMYYDTLDRYYLWLLGRKPMKGIKMAGSGWEEF